METIIQVKQKPGRKKNPNVTPLREQPEYIKEYNRLNYLKMKNTQVIVKCPDCNFECPEQYLEKHKLSKYHLNLCFSFEDAYKLFCNTYKDYNISYTIKT